MKKQLVFFALTLMPSLLFAQVHESVDFVYLRQVDPSIQQDIRYSGHANFLGQRASGYLAAECVLLRKAAQALQRVQRRLNSQGLSLKVYDCYRPQKAVNDFVRWANSGTSPDTSELFHPRVAKNRLIPLGYIASRSGHSKGATIDLTVVPLNSLQPEIGSLEDYDSCISKSDSSNKLPDNSLDMGTGFDCFDVLSHTLNSDIKRVSKNAMAHRKLLLRSMNKEGFSNYSREWWHFRYRRVQTSGRYFDFDILPLSSQ